MAGKKEIREDIMKRVINLSVKDYQAKIKVRIEVTSNGHLAREEINHVVNVLADRSMQALTGTPYIKPTLNQIVVR